MSILIRLFIKLVSKKVKTTKYKDKSLKEKSKMIVQDLISTAICCGLPVILAIMVAVFMFNFLSAGVAQVVINNIDEFSITEKDKEHNRLDANCPCGDCTANGVSKGVEYTTGDLNGNQFDMETVTLINNLAQDTVAYPWMPYGKSAVEFSGALSYSSSLYTNYSSIYSQSTDLVNYGHANSIGLFQIQTTSLGGFASPFVKNKAAFNNIVAKSGGDLSKYKTPQDKSAKDIYEDRLYLPSQLGTSFYYFKESRNDTMKALKEYIPGYDSLNENEKAVVETICVLSAWNNGRSGTIQGFKASSNKKLGKYLVAFAKLYCTDIGYEKIMALEGAKTLNGNSTPKNTRDVLKLLGENLNDYKELDGGNGKVSRIYCYATNAVIGGSYLYTKKMEDLGVTVTGTLGKLGGATSSGGGGSFESIKLTYSDKSVDGEIRKEYDTVFEPMDYSVKLLEMGAGYGTVGSSNDVPDRKFGQIDGIVIHYTAGATGGTAAGVWSWFDKPYTGSTSTGTNTSSHFIIGSGGEIIQAIPLDNQGIAANGADGTKISIEVGYTDVNGAYGTKAYNSLLHLVAWLCVELNIDTDTDFIQGDGGKGGTLYRDLAPIQRHYDVNISKNSLEQRLKACPLFWVPNDNTAKDAQATNGGNSRWISFKKDLTSFILNYRYDANLAPAIDVPGLAEAKELAKGNIKTIWGDGSASSGGSGYGCSCGIPCAKCDCHNDVEKSEAEFKGDLTGKASKSDFGYGSFKGSTWESSQFLDNAKTIMAAMIGSGLDYQEKYYDPIGGFYKIRYDCSGYVSAVLNYSGYTDFDNNTNSGSFAGAFDTKYGWTKIADVGSLKAGDIMVMNTPGNAGTDIIGHVQIYAGNSKVYNVGSKGYFTDYGKDINPKDSSLESAEKRFIFGWRIITPNK